MTDTVKTEDEQCGQQFKAWLIDKNRALYDLAYCWEEEEDEVVYSAKASVLDLKTGWDAGWQARAAQEGE